MRKRETLSTATLLVLEDNASVMTVLRLMLESYNLIEASNAEQALRLFTDHGRQVDLLVADVTLPRSSGIQVALLLRKKIPTLQVILTSGYPVNDWSDGDLADLKRLGSRSVAILQKPFQGKAPSGAACEVACVTRPKKRELMSAGVRGAEEWSLRTPEL